MAFDGQRRDGTGVPCAETRLLRRVASQFSLESRVRAVE